MQDGTDGIRIGDVGECCRGSVLIRFSSAVVKVLIQERIQRQQILQQNCRRKGSSKAVSNSLFSIQFRHIPYKFLNCLHIPYNVCILLTNVYILLTIVYILLTNVCILLTNCLHITYKCLYITYKLSVYYLQKSAFCTCFHLTLYYKI